MTREKRGKELAAEMREAPRTRPPAQWCPVCEQWTSWPHSHEVDGRPRDGGR